MNAKKIIGIFLIILSSLIILRSGYVLIDSLGINREELIEQNKRDFLLFDNDQEREDFVDNHILWERLPAAVFLIIGLGIAYGGYALFKKGKKDKELSDTFKFD